MWGQAPADPHRPSPAAGGAADDDDPPRASARDGASAKDVATWQQEGVLERRGGLHDVRDLGALRRYSDAQQLALACDLSTIFDRLG